MVLKIEIPENIILSKNDELVIRFTNTQNATCTVHTPSNDLSIVPKSTAAESHNTSLLSFVNQLRTQFLQQNKLRLAETYQSALNSFCLYINKVEILMEDIDSKMIEGYESYLKQKKLTLNTISFYMRILRAIYNRAVKSGVIADKKPFDHVFTTMTKTAKRAIPIQVIQKIAQAHITNKNEALARDLFLFSFYTRGMSFVDIAYLKKTDLNNTYLIYKRKKTGQELKIAWRKEMQELVDRNSSKDGVHLFGILDENSEKSLRFQYHYTQCIINTALKRLGKQLNLGTNLTMYVARHSWATIARQKNIPLSVICDGMGHNSEKTTQIYLQSVDAETIDRCNDKLIAAITKSDKKK
ncbi:tyrosine-type recombinase/integrase [Segatella hominis]|uniref:tyrosine-type recombinase/integrase n=1 Tax=Segatella hominis TaxID=2518605 RepID=UPI003AB0E5A8